MSGKAMEKGHWSPDLKREVREGDLRNPGQRVLGRGKSKCIALRQELAWHG